MNRPTPMPTKRPAPTPTQSPTIIEARKRAERRAAREARERAAAASSAPQTRDLFARARAEGRYRGGFVFLPRGAAKPVRPWPWGDPAVLTSDRPRRSRWAALFEQE